MYVFSVGSHTYMVKVKVKFSLEQATKAQMGEYMYSSTLHSASALDVGGWSTPRPGSFTLRKDPVAIVYEAGWAPVSVLRVAENIAHTWI